jgi:hypothetical protein
MPPNFLQAVDFATIGDMTDEAFPIVQRLHQEIESLVVRGLRAATSENIQWLRHAHETLDALGAEFLAGLISKLLYEIEQDDPQSAASLLRLQTSVRLFDRVLTIETARFHLTALAAQIEQENGNNIEEAD